MNGHVPSPPQRIKILLVEDNPGDIRLIELMLAQASGFHADLESVRRFAPAIERLGEPDTDVVLLDLSLPDSFGLDTLIKAQAKAPDVPIVVLTNLDDEERGVEAVQRGAQDYLIKGKVDANLLIRAIRYAITRKQMEVELAHHRLHLEDLVAQRTAAEHEQRIFAEALRDTAAIINGSLNLDEVLDKILDNVERVVPHDAANIMLVNKGIAKVAGRRGYAQRGLEESILSLRLPISETPSLDKMEKNREVLLIPNVDDDPGWFVSDQTRWIRSYVGVPICTDGNLIGFLGLNSATPNYFTPVHGARLQAFVDQAAVAIENAQLHEMTKKRAARLELIADVGNRTTAILEVDQLLNEAVHLISKVFGYYNTNILLAGKNELVLGATTHPAQQHLVRQLRITGSQGITGWVAQHNEPLLVPDTSKDPRYMSVRSDANVHAEMAVPIKLKDQLIGVLDVESIELDAFSGEDLFTLQTIAAQLATAIHNARLYEQIQSHAEELEMRVAERTAELQAANEHLRALSRVKDEFVSNVSHELRTPITNIRLHHELLSRMSDAYADFMPALQRETERLSQIIEDLLRLSRLEQGQVKLNIQPVNFNDFAANFAIDRTALAESMGLKLCFDGAPDLPVVDGDSGLLGQVLSILLTNAMNYTPSGGEVTVSTRTEIRDDVNWVGFAVSDTGPGISPDDQARLFERFFRGQAGRHTGTPGTGLGLAIVKDIVSRHDGRIEVKSEGIPGKGAEFLIWLRAK